MKTMSRGSSAVCQSAPTAVNTHLVTTNFPAISPLPAGTSHCHGSSLAERLYRGLPPGMALCKGEGEEGKKP